MRIPTFLLALTAVALTAQEPTTILNVSYDVSREYYAEINPAFVAHWQAQGKPGVKIEQSHGGSGKQARAVIDGLQADVITMNQALDIDQVAASGLLPADWATRLPHNSAPHASTILFIVRKGNPKNIKDWDDLVRDGIQPILPNPKTSGNGRYSYLAAWGFAKRKFNGDEAQIRAFVTKFFANVPVLDTGGRGATQTFFQRGVGDVLLTFESEVALLEREVGKGQVEVIVPSLSILAENPVSIVDAVVSKKGTSEVANAFLAFLFSPEAQEIAAKHNLRPSDHTVLARHGDRFRPIDLITVDEAVGGWKQAQAVHFADKGVFDQIYTGK